MDSIIPKVQREINQKNEEICRLQQELSYLLHQNELLRKKVDDDEKAELKVNRILLENFACAKQEIIFLREGADAKNREVDYLRAKNAALQQDHLSTLALLDTLSAEFFHEMENSKFNEIWLILEDKKRKFYMESANSLEPHELNTQLLKELETGKLQNEGKSEEIDSKKMELKEQVVGHPNASDLEKQIENLYQDVVEKDNRICEMSLRIKALETLIEKNQSHTAELEKEVVELQAEKSEITHKLSSLEHLAQEKENFLEEQRKQEEMLQKQVDHLGVLETEKELLASSVTALENENVSLSAKLRDVMTILQEEMIHWNLGDISPCLIQGNVIDMTSFTSQMKRVTELLHSTYELQQKKRQLQAAVEELFKDKAKLKENIQYIQNASLAMECELKKRIESMEHELCSKGLRELDEEKEMSDEEKENMAPPMEECAVDHVEEKTVENGVQLGRGRVKSLQEKFLALTLASQSPFKENVLRESNFRKKLWDDNDVRRSPFISNGQNQ